MIDIKKRKIHIKEIVPYMHVWFEPLQRKTLKVFIILHLCTCPLKSLCRLNTNGHTAQEGYECSVVCRVQVCGAIHCCFRTVNMDVNF